MPSDVGILQDDAVEQRLMHVENIDCVDVLYVVYVDERPDVVEDVECVQVGYDECADERFEVIGWKR